MFPAGKRKRLGRKGIALVLLLTQLLVPVGYAEPPPAPDPFGGSPTPREGGIEPEDDILGDPVDNFGFEPPPENLAPPPLPGDGGFGAEPPPPPPPDLEPTPPGNGRPFIPGARGTPPAALGGNNNTRPSSPPPGPGGSSPLRSQLNDPAPRPRNRPTPKLEDYLELDPSVKGLQVQNFDFADKEIKDLVVLISKWTGKNFILDNKVRGRISIVAPSQVTLQEAYQAFLSALDANGLTTVKSGKFIRIIDAAEARRSPVETYAGDYAPSTDQFITRIFQLQYISADEVQREFRDLVSRQGKLFAYAPTNTIIITDQGSNIRRIEDILRTLDVKGFETSLHVLRIRYSSAKQIAEMLDQIYGDDNQTRSRTSRTFRRTTLDRTRGGGIISKVIPDESTNSLIILANRAGFRSLQALVNKLDVRVTDTGRIHVYYCEYAKAEDLAQTLAALSGGGTAGSRSSNNRRNTRVTTPSGAQPPSLTSPGGARPSGATGPVTAELGEGIKITADPPTNSLVITASSSDYQTLKRVIRKLDIPRLQVFVETAILEVTLDNQKNISTNLATSANGLLFSGGTISDSNFLTNLFTGGIPEGATIPILGGRRVQVTAGGQTINLRSFAAILNFLTKTTQTSVLSTPQILALDNEKSEFKVQDEIPVQAGIPPSGASVGAGVAGNVANIERLKTGIEIKLTPHVNAASRSIRLEIEQKVDSLASNANVPAQLANIQRAKTTRETNTNVVVKDGDYIMLGGLMSDKVDEAVSKVPLLGDIPILGWLFKKQTTSVVKTNLVILLHPRIIGTSLQGAELISDKLRRRKDFIDRNAGGNDDHADEVKDLTRRVESQRRRGRGNLPPAYRNDNERARPSREEENEEENPPVNEDFADPDRPVSRSEGENRNKESEEVRSDPKARLMPEEGKDQAPAEDPLLLPPDSEGGGPPGDIPPPPPPPEGFEPPPGGEVE